MLSCKSLAPLVVGPAIVCGASGCGAAHDRQPAGGSVSHECRLVLPPAFYAVAGRPLTIVHRNLILAAEPRAYEVTVRSPLLTSASREKTTLLGGVAQVGEWGLTVEVRRSDGGAVVDGGTAVVSVSAAIPPTGPPIRLLLVGDSLTAGAFYVDDLASMLGARGSFLGTRITAKGHAHEGWPGAGWMRLATFFSQPEGDTPNSPFLSAPGRLDIPAYGTRIGGSPVVVTWLLGTNDVFAAPLDTLEDAVTTTFSNANRLLAAFHQTFPDADLVIAMPPVGNDRAEAFQTDYDPPDDDRWVWRQKIHRWQERTVEEFGGREAERIHLVPLYSALDGTSDYPADNALHPLESGHHVIAETLYAWLAAH